MAVKNNFNKKQLSTSLFLWRAQHVSIFFAIFHRYCFFCIYSRCLHLPHLIRKRLLFVYVYLIFSGTVPITQLTDTTNPTHVKTLIEQNIHRKRYEKACKEFLDEKRNITETQRNSDQVQEGQATQRKAATRKNAHSTTVSRSNSPTIVPLTIESRLRNRLQKVQATRTKAATRKKADSTTASKSNTPTIMILPSNSRVGNHLQTRNNDQVIVVETEVRCTNTMPQRRSSRLCNKHQKKYK